MQNVNRRLFMRNALIILTLFWLAPMLSSANVVIKASAIADDLALDYSVASLTFDDSPSFDSETPDALTHALHHTDLPPCTEQSRDFVVLSNSRFVRTSAIRAPPY